MEFNTKEVSLNDICQTIIKLDEHGENNAFGEKLHPLFEKLTSVGMLAGGFALSVYSKGETRYSDIDVFIKKEHLNDLMAFMLLYSSQRHIKMNVSKIKNKTSSDYTFGRDVSDDEIYCNSVVTCLLEYFAFKGRYIGSKLLIQLIVVDVEFLPDFLRSFDADYIQCGIYNGLMYYSDRFKKTVDTNIHSEIRLFGSRKRLAKAYAKGFQIDCKAIIHLYKMTKFVKPDSLKNVLDVMDFIENMKPINTSETESYKWCKINTINPIGLKIGTGKSYHRSCIDCNKIIHGCHDDKADSIKYDHHEYKNCEKNDYIRIPIMFEFEVQEVDSGEFITFTHTSCLCKVKYSKCVGILKNNNGTLLADKYHHMKKHGSPGTMNPNEDDEILVMLRFTVAIDILSGTVHLEIEHEYKDPATTYTNVEYHDYDTLIGFIDNFKLTYDDEIGEGNEDRFKINKDCDIAYYVNNKDIKEFARLIFNRHIHSNEPLVIKYN